MNSDHLPLQLPWLARRAGLSDARTAALWREASAYAQQRCAADSADFYRTAMDRLHALIDAESRRLDAQSSARTWSRLQRRTWSLQMAWLESGASIAARTWRLLSRQKRCHCC